MPLLIAALLCTVASAASLTFSAPPGWKTVATSSSMRVAQFALPRAAGDPADAELVVYYFGGSGGTVEANIERWLGQMQQPDGKPSSAVAKRGTRTVNGLKVTLVDVERHLCRRNDTGLPATPQQPELPPARRGDRNAERPLLHQADRTAQTIAASEQSFEAFLGSVKYQ